MALSTRLSKTKNDLADDRRSIRVWKLYEKLFGEAPPAGWTIEWGIDGLTILQMKTIYLFCYNLQEEDALETVVHELLHVNSPHLEHGPIFDKVVRVLMKKATGGH
jgi:hypothetical protein